MIKERWSEVVRDLVAAGNPTTAALLRETEPQEECQLPSGEVLLWLRFNYDVLLDKWNRGNHGSVLGNSLARLFGVEVLVQAEASVRPVTPGAPTNTGSWKLFRGKPQPANDQSPPGPDRGCPGCRQSCEESYLVLMPNGENLYGFCEKCVDLRLLMWCIERWNGRPVIVRGLMAVTPPTGDTSTVRIDPIRSFNATQKKEIYSRSNGHCVGCGQPLDSDWHADHIVPHSRGGRTEIVNAQALCQPCNSRKKAKVLTVDEE